MRSARTGFRGAPALQSADAAHFPAGRRLQRRRPLVARPCRPCHRTRRTHRPDRPQRRWQVDPAQAAVGRTQGRRRRGAGGRRPAHRPAGAGSPAGRGWQRVRRGRRGAGRPRRLACRLPPPDPCRGHRRGCAGRGAGAHRGGRRLGAGPARAGHAGAPATGWRCRLRPPVGRDEAAGAAGARAGVAARPAAAGRAHQPPRHRRDRLAGRLPQAVDVGRQHGAGVHHPRPPLPARPRHPHRGNRSRPGDQLARRLGELPAPQGGTGQRRGAGERPLRQAAGAGGSLDPAGHQGPAHPRRRPRAPAEGDAGGARGAPRAGRQREDGRGAGRRIRQEGDRGTPRRLRPWRQSPRPRFQHHNPARRPHRPGRAERQRQDHAAEAAAGRAGAAGRRGEAGHPAAGGLLRPVPGDPARGLERHRERRRGPRERDRGRQAEARHRLPAGLPVHPGTRPRADHPPVRRRAQPPIAGAPVRPAVQPAGDGRADQRPRRRDPGIAGRAAGRLPGHAAAGQPRPRFPRQQW